MGSPCNTFGNEPAAGSAEPLGTGSQIVPPAGGALCSHTRSCGGRSRARRRTRRNGDAIMTRNVRTARTPDAPARPTREFNPLGYFYIVRVAQRAVSQPVTLQIYDPAFVETDDLCEDAPDEHQQPAGTNVRNNMNSYANTDGLARYYGMSPAATEQLLHR